MPIQNDEQYEAVLGRIRKGVEFISNPLTSAEDKQRYLKKYDELVEEVRTYRRVECHGYDYLKNGFGNVQETTHDSISSAPPARVLPEDKTHEKTNTEVKSALSAFLDDD
jgi:hypothetical protein